MLERLTAADVRVTQVPVVTAPVTMAVPDDVCGNPVQGAQAARGCAWDGRMARPAEHSPPHRALGDTWTLCNNSLDEPVVVAFGRGLESPTVLDPATYATVLSMVPHEPA